MEGSFKAGTGGHLPRRLQGWGPGKVFTGHLFPKPWPLSLLRARRPAQSPVSSSWASPELLTLLRGLKTPTQVTDAGSRVGRRGTPTGQRRP